MAFVPISGIVPQATENGNQANGMVLKFYEPGTLTPLAVGIDSTGVTQTTEFVLSIEGYTTLSGNEEIPHVDQIYKIVLYLDQADADANDTGSAVYVIDNVDVGGFASTQSQSFKDFDNLSLAVNSPDIDVGDFITTGEYNSDSGVGGGKYQKVSSDPGANTLNPATSDGNFLLFINDYDFITSSQVGLIATSLPGDVVSALNNVYPYLFSKNWSVSIVNILDADDEIDVTVPTYSAVKGVGGFLFSAPSVAKITALRMTNIGATLESLSITVATGSWNRCITQQASETKILNNDIFINSTLPDSNPGSFNTDIVYGIFNVPPSGLITDCEIVSNDIKVTSLSKATGILAASSSNAIVRYNNIHDITSTNGSNFHWGIYMSTVCINHDVGYNDVIDCDTGGIHLLPNDGSGLDTSDRGRKVHDNNIINSKFIGLSIDSCNAARSWNNTLRGCDRGIDFITGCTDCSSTNDKVFDVKNAQAAGADVNKPAIALNNAPRCKVINATIGFNTQGNTKLNITVESSPGAEIINADASQANGEAFVSIPAGSDGAKVTGGKWVHPTGAALSNNAINVVSNECVIDSVILDGSGQSTGGNNGVRIQGNNVTLKNSIITGFTTQNFNTTSVNPEIIGNIFSGGTTTQFNSSSSPINQNNVGLADNLTDSDDAGLNASANIINLLDKYAGKKVTNNTTNIDVFADGPLIGDFWRDFAGAIVNTPV